MNQVQRFLCYQPSVSLLERIRRTPTFRRGDCQWLLVKLDHNARLEQPHAIGTPIGVVADDEGSAETGYMPVHTILWPLATAQPETHDPRGFRHFYDQPTWRLEYFNDPAFASAPGIHARYAGVIEEVGIGVNCRALQIRAIKVRRQGRVAVNDIFLGHVPDVTGATATLQFGGGHTMRMGIMLRRHGIPTTPTRKRVVWLDTGATRAFWAQEDRDAAYQRECMLSATGSSASGSTDRSSVISGEDSVALSERKAVQSIDPKSSRSSSSSISDSDTE